MAVRHPSPLQSTRVAIVGAGPTGYLTAIILHKQGLKSITLIDRQENPSAFHHTRAYTLCLYQLGQRLLHELPDLFTALKRIALEQHVRTVTTVSQHASSHTSHTPLAASPVYWLMRSDLIHLLATYMKQHCPDITLLTGHCVHDLHLHPQGNALNLITPDTSHTLLPADLIIACDGSHSRMRQLARQYEPHISTTRGLDMYTRHSPSVGMCPKGLIISAPIVSPPGMPAVMAQPHVIYRFMGASFDLLFLPVGATERRVAMLCVDAGHAVWGVRSGEEAFEMFERNFPQLRVRDLFSREEMERFAREKPMAFCAVERPMSLVGTFKSGGSGSGGGGVLFLGDAAHSFPPDTAQGINSSMEDVRILKGVLEDGGSRSSVQEVLDMYERRRDGEIWELMELVKLSSPYQYEQNRVGYMGHMLNKMVRGGLSALVPGLFHPIADTLIRQNYDYSKVRQLSDSTTRNMMVLVLSLVGLAVLGMVV